MAEGLLRHRGGDCFAAFSAGQSSKTLDRYLGERCDAVITVCDQANEACPIFPRRGAAAAVVVRRREQGDRH